MKTCPRCKVEKGRSEFGKNRSCKDGLSALCRPCNVEHVRQWRAKNPGHDQRLRERRREKPLVYSPDTPRVCQACSEKKTVSDFYADFGRADCLAINCKECVRAAVTEVYWENPEARRAYSQGWRKRNPERASQSIEAYREQNKEALAEAHRLWRERNASRVQANEARRLERDRAKIYAKNARKRASRRNATPKWLTAIQQAQVDEFYEIARARTVQTGIVHHVDHIQPLIGENLCGLHVPWNLAVLPARENLAKGNRLTDEHLTLARAA